MILWRMQSADPLTVGAGNTDCIGPVTEGCVARREEKCQQQLETQGASPSQTAERSPDSGADCELKTKAC